MSHDIYVTIGSSTPISVSIDQPGISTSVGGQGISSSINSPVISAYIDASAISLSINNPVVIGSAEKILIIPISGSLVANKTLLENFYFDKSISIFKLGIHLDRAALGNNITIDLLKDEVVQSRIATLAAGARGSITDIEDITYTSSEKFDIKILTTGTFPDLGEGGTIAIHYK